MLTAISGAVADLALAKLNGQAGLLDYSVCSDGAYEMPIIEPSLESSRATV